MKHAPPVARPGDVCILLEPDSDEIPAVRTLQSHLQTSYGGRRQDRIHFTCQRFSLQDTANLPQVVHVLQKYLAPINPFPVRAKQLELVDHPFWEFSVLRWDLHRTDQMWRFARLIERTLQQVGMSPHYPCGQGWRPHVTALEAIVSPNGHSVNGTHQGQLLYTAHRITLSQVQEGKQFQILATILLN